MSFENLTRCPRCKQPLALSPIWPNTVRRWKKPRISSNEFDFHCERCNRDYTLKGNTLLDKAPETVSTIEDEALDPSKTENTFDNRCPECGRATMWELGTALVVCLWCNRDYVLADGELQPKGPEQNTGGRSITRSVPSATNRFIAD